MLFDGSHWRRLAWLCALGVSSGSIAAEAPPLHGQTLPAHPPIFQNAENVTCRYRLDGLQKEFTETNLSEVNYSSLPAGDYSFQVICDVPQLDQSKSAAYSFTVPAAGPWWQRSWTAMGAGGVALLIWATLWSRYRDRRENERLERAVAERSAELARANRELQEASLSDPLTGLANRRALMRVLDAFFASAGAGESRLILFDLNGFKSYNDTFGHPAGDALLVRLAAKLKAHVGDGGEAFRIGGDEFCALIPATHSACATQLAEAPSWLSEDGDGYAIGCSCGAIQIPAEARCPSEALRIADHRMYAHKNHARTCAGRRVRDTRLRGTS